MNYQLETQYSNTFGLDEIQNEIESDSKREAAFAVLFENYEGETRQEEFWTDASIGKEII